MNSPTQPEESEAPEESASEEPDASGPDGPDPDPNRSGLRDPQRAIAALGGIILGLEALVLLLAIVPMRMMDIPHLGVATTLVLVMVVVAIVLAGMCRRGWAWWAGAALQLAILASGFVFHWALAGVGVIFGLTWWFALSVRGKLSRPPQRD